MYPGITSHEDSAQRSVDVAMDEHKKGNAVVLMGHNAPSGETFVMHNSTKYEAGSGIIIVSGSLSKSFKILVFIQLFLK